MSHRLAAALAAALALSLALPAVAAPAEQPATSQKRVTAKKPIKKRAVSRHRHRYGFLPGYRPPKVIAEERAERYWEDRPYYYYGPAWPRFYHGRWNGGGFGPCYVLTPIGYMWTCGR
jgi:hypothetical protein